MAEKLNPEYAQVEDAEDRVHLEFWIENQDGDTVIVGKTSVVCG